MPQVSPRDPHFSSGDAPSTSDHPGSDRASRSFFNPERMRPRVGSIAQIAGVDLVESIDGEERGVRKALVRTGGGLQFEVLIDRGFDIGRASFRGVNLTWRSPAGAVHPYAYRGDDDGWLGLFPGGLLVTCGPENVGPPSEGRPLHGTQSVHRARLRTSHLVQDDGRFKIELEGEVRHYTLFGDHVIVRRRLIAPCGGATIYLEDRIENAGSRRAPLMWLYHCNFGYPLLDDGAEVVVKSRIEPRDVAARSGLPNALRTHAPQAGNEEQVFFHDAEVGTDGQVRVALLNRRLPLAASIAYRKRDLPHLTQWKQLGRGEYVMGLEPATCRVLGFEKENAAGRVQWLEPGEVRAIRLEIACTDSPEDIESLKSRTSR